MTPIKLSSKHVIPPNHMQITDHINNNLSIKTDNQFGYVEWIQ